MIEKYWKIWVDTGEEKSLDDLKTPDNVQSDDFSFEEACCIAADELSWKINSETLTLLVQRDDKFYEVTLARDWVCNPRTETTVDIITGNY